MGHFLGAEKIFFLIRDIDDATRAGAPVEICQFVVLRSPGGRLGSVLDTCNRLRRVRWCFHRWVHISTGPQPESAGAQVPKVLDPELPGEHQALAHAA